MQSSSDFFNEPSGNSSSIFSSLQICILDTPGLFFPLVTYLQDIILLTEV